MRVFVGEYVCGGGFPASGSEQPTASLRDEGAAMLAAVCEDTLEVAEVITVADARWTDGLLATAHVHLVQGFDDLAQQWLAIASGCDAAILIAPETDGVLRSLASDFRTSFQGQLIAPDDEFIRVSTDKAAFAQRMHQADVPHPITLESKYSYDAVSESGWIAKPRDGCGSEALRSFGSLADAPADGVFGGQRIIQMRHRGVPASIAAIVGEQFFEWLPACEQFIDPQSFVYGGGSSPLGDSLHQRALRLAKAAVAAMPGEPFGYIGVDLVLGDSPQEDVVIEINPRLTTSFVGLRRLLRGNLAAKMLGMESGPLEFASGVRKVTWNASGMVTTSGQQ